MPSNDSLVLKSTDTSKVTKISVQDVQAPSDTTFLGIKIPTWALNIFMALLTLLPAIQVILKRIPSDVSLKIGGWLGKLLDVLTFFQKDVITTPPAAAKKDTTTS